jgi:hypothetical protein
MKKSRIPLILLLCLSSSACNPKSENSPPSGYRDYGSAKYEEKDFSAWMSKAEQKTAYDAKSPGSYFSYTEGRNNSGFNQYRQVKATFPQEKFTEWGVFWGLTADEFYQLELKMLASGFVRQNLQVFTDSQGLALHQVVWLKPKPISQ